MESLSGEKFFVIVQSHGPATFNLIYKQIKDYIKHSCVIVTRSEEQQEGWENILMIS